MSRFRALSNRILIALSYMIIPGTMFLFLGLDQNRSDFEPYLHRPEIHHLLWSLGYCVMFLALRHTSVKLLRPLGFVVLSPEKRSQSDRLDRFASVSSWRHYLY